MTHDTVNASASKLAGQTIHGDCVVQEDDARSWGIGLPTGLLSLIAARLGEMDNSNASAMLPIIGVNRAWRNELTEDQRFLKSIRFVLRDPWNPLLKKTHSETQKRCLEKRPVFGFKLQYSFSREDKRISSLQTPKILHLCSSSGNVGSAAVLACFHEASGNREEASKWWTKAAKGGDVEALFHHGFHLYSVLDLPDDAVGYLSRAIKAVLALESLLQLPPNVPMEVRDDPSLCDLVSRASLILGYAYLDGHGVKSDNELAVKLFKLAGCSEGQRALGWLYNTGQY